MVTQTLLYVASVAVPAVLVAIAFDALRHVRARWLESIAWATLAGTLLLALWRPSVLARVGLSVGAVPPTTVIAFVGSLAAFLAYVRFTARSRIMEQRLADLEQAVQISNAAPDEVADAGKG